MITTAAFKRACREGETTYRYGRIMVTGKFGDGKTSLIQALLGKSIPVEHIPTEGLDAQHSCKVNIIRCTEEWAELLVDKTEMVSDDVAYAIIDCEKQEQTQMMDTKPLDDYNKMEVMAQSSGKYEEKYLERPSEKPKLQEKHIDKKLFEKVNEKKQAEKGTTHERKAVIFMWDFGGQEAYKNLHPIFLRSDCVHIVVYDLEKLQNAQQNEELRNYSDQIEFWLQMILSNSGKHNEAERFPYVLLVGTHKDMLMGKDTLEKEHLALQLEQILKGKLSGKKYKYLIADYFHVDSKGGIHEDSENFKKLKQCLMKCIINCPNWEEKRPIRYMQVLGRLYEEEEKPGQAIVDLKQVEYAEQFNMDLADDVKQGRIRS